jgi:hypothetical protein
MISVSSGTGTTIRLLLSSPGNTGRNQSNDLPGCSRRLDLGESSLIHYFAKLSP